MNSVIINRKQARKMMIECGQIYSAIFVKKDKSIRKMTCKQGVQKHLKGGKMPYKPTEYGLIGTFDMKKRAYRLVNLNTLLELRMNNQHFVITNHPQIA
jgi:hypothetical protein